MFQKLFIVLLFSTFVLSENAFDRVNEKCGLDSECFEKSFKSLIDEYDKNGVKLFDGAVSVEKKVAEEETIPEGRSNEGLWERIIRYLGDREVKVNIPKKYIEEGRGLKKIGKILLPIIFLLKLKAIIIIPIVLTVIALVALGGLGAGTGALLISGCVALKYLLSSNGPHPGNKVTYEIIPPHHDLHWNRQGQGLGGSALPGAQFQQYPEVDPYYRTIPNYPN